MPHFTASQQYETLSKYLADRKDIPAKRRKLTYGNAQWVLDNADKLPKEMKAILTACIRKHHKYEAFNDPIYQYSLTLREQAANKLQAAYAAKGITVSCHVYDDPPKIDNILIEGFTNAQWVDMFSVSGEILPACCAQISHVRDELMSAARNERYIRPWDLCKIANILKDHSCGHVPEPLNKLVELWEAVKDDCKLHPEGYTVDPNQLDDALSVLSRAANTIVFNGIMSESGDMRVYQQKMNRIHQLHCVMPAVRTVYNYFLGQNLPDIDGWGVCDGDEVYLSALGLIIGRTKEQAEYWRDIINKAEADNNKARYRNAKKKVRELTIRPVRLSVKDGITFMDTEVAGGLKPHEPPPEQLETDHSDRKRRRKKK